MLQFNIFFLFGMLALSQLQAQEKTAPRKWETGYGIGWGSGICTGLLPSRNAINFSNAANFPITENPDAIVKGITLDFVLGRKFGKNILGLQLSGWGITNSMYKDDQTSQTILADSLKKITIISKQSFAHLGLNYSRELYRTQKGKGPVSIHLGLWSGYSVNLTPDRTEFDYYSPEGFLTYSTEGDSTTTFLIGTDFRSGYFICPALTLKYRIAQTYTLHLQWSMNFQWQKTDPIFEEIYNTPVTTLPQTSPLMQPGKYVINGRFIKLYFTF
jgi:hypothetical protein